MLQNYLLTGRTLINNSLASTSDPDVSSNVPSGSFTKSSTDAMNESVEITDEPAFRETNIPRATQSISNGPSIEISRLKDAFSNQSLTTVLDQLPTQVLDKGTTREKSRIEADIAISNEPSTKVGQNAKLGQSLVEYSKLSASPAEQLAEVVEAIMTPPDQSHFRSSEESGTKFLHEAKDPSVTEQSVLPSKETLVGSNVSKGSISTEKASQQSSKSHLVLHSRSHDKSGASCKTKDSKGKLVPTQSGRRQRPWTPEGPTSHKKFVSFDTKTKYEDRNPEGSKGSSSIVAMNNEGGGVCSECRELEISFSAFVDGRRPSFIDSHCHLDFLMKREEEYGKTYGHFMLKRKDTYPESYEGCVAVFCNPFTFKKSFVWQRYLNESGVWGAFGCHPHNANFYDNSVEDALCEALKHPKVCALGEIGLDYSRRNCCPRRVQQSVLRRQLHIALREGLPLVIHCRDANEDCMRILKELVPSDHLVHLHCFTGDWSLCSSWLDAFSNLFVGLTNFVAHSRETRDAVHRIPLHRLLLETDAPYFMPLKLSGRWSHPGMAIHVAMEIATLKQLPLDEVLHWTRFNTHRMYGI